MLQSRKDILFVILTGIFITNAVVAELIGGKLITIAGFPLSIGILPWPVVFLTTDIINEYFGHKGVRRLTFITAGLISYAFILLFIGIRIPAVDFSPVKDPSFKEVFGQSNLIIIGSLIAFILSQLLDIYIFNHFKNKTGDKHLWLRATGSTVFSQLIDTFIVAGIAFYLPGKLTLNEYVTTSMTGYTAKLGIAVMLTPFIYLAHYLISNYLKKEKSK